MARKILTDIDLAKNALNNARIQNLASAPSSPVVGQVYYDTTLSKFGTFNGSTWDYMGTSGATGDFSSNTATSVDGEVVVFSGTGGKTGKRATGSGIAKLASGVLGTATAGTDYVAATSGSAVQKANGAGGLTAATAGTDYSAGTAALGTGIIKSTTTTGALTIAVAGDFPTLNQSTTGSAATLTTPRSIYGNNFDGSAALGQVIASTYGGTGNGFAKLSGPATTEKTFTLPNATATILTDNAAVTIAQGGTGVASLPTGILKGAGTGAITAAVSSTDYAPATGTTSALKGNGSGGFSAATLNDVGAATADYSINSHKLTNVLDPTAAQDAATKNYVDLARQGLSLKDPVRVATTANGTLASAYANGSTVDGITLATGDRILIKNQTTASENGIYIVAASGAPARSTDADASGELVVGTVTLVQSGTVNGGQRWAVTATGATPWVPNSSTSTWTQESGASTTTAGGGLTATGNVFAVGAGTGIVVNADSVTVDRATNGSIVPFKFSATIGDGSTTAIAVTHNLGTRDVHAQIYDASTFAVVECDIVHTSTTVSTFTFNTAPATNAYRVVIIG